jgi:alkaline phosphatase D
MKHDFSRRKALAGLGGLAGLVGCANAPQSNPLAPLNVLQPISRIAFGSCADQTKDQPIWDAVLADKPDLFVFGGDNVYASGPTFSVGALRAAYAQLAAKPGFAKLRSTVAHMEIWDDHDFGSNDGGGNFAQKAASKAEFLEFWGAAPFDQRRSRDGLYKEQLIGPQDQRVQVIVLDARWFRSDLKATDERGAPGKERYVPDADPSKTMLGAAQWAWLEERLSQPADVRFICSGIQVWADGHGWECWANLPHERERLAHLIAKTKANGVVMLSGDRHIGAMYKYSGAGAYPLYEVTSSGLTHAWAQAREAGPNRLTDLVTVNHYGLISIDWARRDMKFELKDEKGKALESLDVDLKFLQS